jgi:hypothetical protein
MDATSPVSSAAMIEVEPLHGGETKRGDRIVDEGQVVLGDRMEEGWIVGAGRLCTVVPYEDMETCLGVASI